MSEFERRIATIVVLAFLAGTICGYWFALMLKTLGA